MSRTRTGTSRGSRHGVRSGIAALAVALLTGCTGSGGEEDQPAAATSSGSGASVEERSTEVLVEQTVSRPDAPQDRVTIGVESLTVEGTTMVLRLVVTPDFASVPDGEPVTLGDAMGVGGQFFGVALRLIDRENLTEYSVVHEGSRWWASGAYEVETVDGEPMSAFAVFAAPQDDIDTIDVRLDEQWPELLDVPVTR